MRSRPGSCGRYKSGFLGMLLQNEHDLVLLLAAAAALLLTLAIAAGVIATLKTFQVRQFEDLLFKAERKIDTLERRMFSVLNAVPVALVETDTTGKFTFANKAAHQLLGRKDSELIGLRFHSATWGISYPDGRAIAPDMMPIARTLRGQTVKGFQHMLTNHGSHEKVLVSVTSMPITNNAGEVTGTTSAMVEIETSFGEGVDDINGLWRGHWFAAATVPFWGLDAKGTILDINSAALDAFDLKREQVVNQNWSQLFVADADFQKALDYLGDTQDDSEPHNQKSVRLTLKGQDGDSRTAIVTAWVVRTHEGGDNGLTVMAMPADGAEAASPLIAAPVMPSVTAPIMGDDDAQELLDLRQAELARAALGVGTWQYDPDADTIVEDEGMMALIGRQQPGGPTLISDADQAVADAEFARLLGGDSDVLSLDIKVVHDDGSEHWITLKGQALTQDGRRDIFGVAIDCTEWKMAPTGLAAEPAAVFGEDDLALARQQARDEVKTEHDTALEKALEVALEAAKAEHDKALETALQAALAAARAEHEAELSAVKDQAHDVYGWQTPAPAAEPVTETVVVHQPDPDIVAENEALKAQLDSLQTRLDGIASTLDDTEARRNELQLQLDEIIFARPVADARDDRIESLQADLDQAHAAHQGVQAKLDEVLNTPPPEPDFSDHEARIEQAQADLARAKLETSDAMGAMKIYLDTLHAAERDRAALQTRVQQLQAVEDDKARLQAQLAEVLAAPVPEPDTSAWEARLADTRFELAKWQAAYHDAQGKLDAMPDIDHDALDRRMSDMQAALTQAQQQQAQMQSRLDQVNDTLSHAQRFETIGRLTSDVAQDFAQMLNVINGALEVLSRQNESPESVKRLSEAALAAGKRGERLTRQLQAFQTEDY